MRRCGSCDIYGDGVDGRLFLVRYINPSPPDEYKHNRRESETDSFFEERFAGQQGGSLRRFV